MAGAVPPSCRGEKSQGGWPGAARSGAGGRARLTVLRDTQRGGGRWRRTRAGAGSHHSGPVPTFAPGRTLLSQARGSGRLIYTIWSLPGVLCEGGTPNAYTLRILVAFFKGIGRHCKRCGESRKISPTNSSPCYNY